MTGSRCPPGSSLTSKTVTSSASKALNLLTTRPSATSKQPSTVKNTTLSSVTSWATTRSAMPSTFRTQSEAKFSWKCTIKPYHGSSSASKGISFSSLSVTTIKATEASTTSAPSSRPNAKAGSLLTAKLASIRVQDTTTTSLPTFPPPSMRSLDSTRSIRIWGN